MAADVGEALAAAAAEARDRFGGGRRVRVRASNVVHALGLARWLVGEQVPAPLCHVGIAGWELTAISPTDQPVTCGRCLRLIGVGEQVSPQLALFDLV